MYKQNTTLYGVFQCLENCSIWTKVEIVYILISSFLYLPQKLMIQQAKEGPFHPSLSFPHPPTGKNWDIYLRLCIWEVYFVFSTKVNIFSRLLLDEIDPSLRISVWLNVDFIFLVKRLLIFHWQTLDLFLHLLSP